MANAAVGDDVYHDDPTVNQLEADAAALLGKEAAVFVTSGTQGNLCALLAHCQRGDSIIIGDTSHIFRYEQGGVAQFGGILPAYDSRTGGRYIALKRHQRRDSARRRA